VRLSFFFCSLRTDHVTIARHLAYAPSHARQRRRRDGTRNSRETSSATTMATMLIGSTTRTTSSMTNIRIRCLRSLPRGRVSSHLLQQQHNYTNDVQPCTRTSGARISHDRSMTGRMRRSWRDLLSLRLILLDRSAYSRDFKRSSLNAELS
jgi:hypothetical protein